MNLQPVTNRFSLSNLKYGKQAAMLTAENNIIRSLPADVKNILQPSLKRVGLTKEQFVYQEEDLLEYVYFPETAVVSEFKILEDGRMVEVAVIGREGAIGLSSFFSESGVIPNCTQVTQAGYVQRIDTETLTRLTHQNEELRTHLIQPVDQYIRQISQKSICHMYHSVKERLCTWLLMLNDRCGRKVLNLTHEHIARVLGVYRPSVTCIAQELRKDNLIDYSRGGISIRDRSRVEQSACACYFELGGLKPVH